VSDGPLARVASWNVNSLRVRLPHLSQWLAANPVDVLAIQETKVPDAEFPFAEIAALGYQCVASGQKSYNGVALLARQNHSEVTPDIPGFDDEHKRVLASTVDGVRIIDVYVPNGQALDSPKFAYKLQWLSALRDYLDKQLAAYPRLVVLGDFNIAPEDRDVHHPEEWAGGTHVSAAEREALRSVTGLGLVDVFRRYDQPEKSYTWWDYRAAAFRRNHGLRIDIVLASAGLAERCIGCRIDRTPRTLERPSDHAPVIAEFACQGAAA
jgi:exodeoxyribonuclease III